MKDFFKNIQNLLIVVLVIIILIMRSCSGNKNIPEPKIITETIIEWDTVVIEKTQYVPKWRTKVTTIHDTVLADVDTAFILNDYYSTYAYTDTLSLDSLGSIIINDTISKNSILFRDVQPNIFIPTTTVTNTSYLYKREFFGGISIGGMINPVQNESPINYVGGELMYVNKKRNVYGFGLGVDNNFLPIISGRLYWKIGK